MSIYESLTTLLFKFDPEFVHNWTFRILQFLPPLPLIEQDKALSVSVAGIKFPTPVSLAAGFDKDAKAPGWMLGFGFGSVEIGTVTPRPQEGNERPRLFRLKEDKAVINRFGFNNDGQDRIEQRLAKRLRRRRKGIVGVNIGANKDSADKGADYVDGIRKLGRYANYITINISSPNTPGLRDLQSEDHLPRLIERLVAVRDITAGPPLFLKVSPDLNDNEIRKICRISSDGGIDGIIVGNTTTSRSPSLKSPFANQIGGLSGEPLKPVALSAMRAFRSEVGNRLPLIGVGGIGSAEDAYERIKAGATLIQLYTALAYKGPGLVKSINRGLLELLRRDGLASISEAVGFDDRSDRHVSASTYVPPINTSSSAVNRIYAS